MRVVSETGGQERVEGIKAQHGSGCCGSSARAPGPPFATLMGHWRGPCFNKERDRDWHSTCFHNMQCRSWTKREPRQ